jgi:hypothetical protein
VLRSSAGGSLQSPRRMALKMCACPHTNPI